MSTAVVNEYEYAAAPIVLFIVIALSILCVLYCVREEDMRRQERIMRVEEYIDKVRLDTLTVVLANKLNVQDSRLIRTLVQREQTLSRSYLSFCIGCTNVCGDNSNCGSLDANGNQSMCNVCRIRRIKEYQLKQMV